MPGLPPPDFAVAGGARTSRSNPTTPRGREAVSSLGGREAEQRRPSDETVATLRRPSDETVATLRRRPSNGDQPTTLTTAPSGNPPAAMAGATGAHDGALPPELDDVDDEEMERQVADAEAEFNAGRALAELDAHVRAGAREPGAHDIRALEHEADGAAVDANGAADDVQEGAPA